MKDSPMKNTSYWKSKHSESSDASALKFKEGGFTSSPLKIEPVTAIMAAISLASMAKGAIDKKKAKHAAGMSAAGSKASSGATMSQGIKEGPKGGFA